MNLDNVKIDGVYRFFINDELVSEQKNALTETGRLVAIKSLLGIIPDFADSIAYGISSESNTLNSASTLITNNILDFEIGRTEVVTSTYEVSGSNDVLVYTGTINDAYQYSIYEVGLFPSNGLNKSVTLDGSLLFNFDNLDRFIKYGTYTSASLTTASPARIGAVMLCLPQGDGTTNYLESLVDQTTFISMKFMGSKDLVKLALFNISSTEGASVNFRFFTDDSNYYTLGFVSPATASYHVVSVEKGSASTVGAPDWNNINKIRIWNLSASTAYLDGLKTDFGSYYIDATTGMISRATLATPVFKPSSVPVNIQYSLIVNFNGGV